MSQFKLSKGIQDKPFLMVVYGVEGIGKTTFACDAPNPIVIDIEGGSSNIDITRIESTELKNYQNVIEAMNQAAALDFDTIVIDSLSKLEELIWAETCNRKSVNGKTYKSVEDFGFKQGYIFALDEWQKFIETCVAVRDAGKNVILVAHNTTKKFDDPTLIESYTRYEIDLHPKAAGLIRKYVEAVLFANYKTLVKDGKGLETGERYLFTERRPGHDAKNRFCLPYEVNLNWADFVAAKNGAKEDPDVYKRQIIEMVNDIPNDETRGKILDALEADLSIAQLKAYVKRVETIIGAEE